jgi:zinc/manganese transport system substrate-binding protein
MPRNVVPAFAALLLALALAPLADGWARPLTVASLSTITTDIARNVGGAQVTVIPIVGPDVDPHEFQPSPSDVRRITGADLVLITGKGMEGYLVKLEESAGAARFVDAGRASASLRMTEDGKDVEDPHWWQSIGNVEQAAVLVKEAFIRADPAHRAGYEANAAAYLQSLAALDAWAKEKVAGLPRERRKLVTSHDAFQYFARDFGFEIHAIEGVSSEDQPSSKKVAALIRVIEGEGVKAVFFENIENPKVIAAITRETGAKVGGELYADGLGRGAATYVEMMRHNVATVVDGLK